jgi:regulator of protease activity HflC (stomatin/prohibitin superfamily)
MAAEKEAVFKEIEPAYISGMAMLIINILLMLAAIAVFIIGAVLASGDRFVTAGVVLIVAGGLYACLIGPILFAGLKVLKPNEAYVLTLFGRYYGTLKGEGFFFVNPFVTAVNPASQPPSTLSVTVETSVTGKNNQQIQLQNKKISLKAMTLNNNTQKINDLLGNPIIIGIVVIWRVVNTAKAVFNVDNFKEYLSIQADSALRNIVRLLPVRRLGRRQ